jgi:hypothetical protein
VDVPIGIQQNVVRLDVPVYDVLPVYVSYRATQFSNPEPDSLFRKRLSRYVESKVAAAHQVHYQVPWGHKSASVRGEQQQQPETLHVLNVLEAVAQIANERVVHMLEHSSFADDIADAFGADDWMLS